MNSTQYSHLNTDRIKYLTFKISDFKMQKNVNTEFEVAEKSQNRHNLKILDERSNAQKFASFEGTCFYLTTLFYKHLGLKKAPH